VKLARLVLALGLAGGVATAALVVSAGPHGHRVPARPPAPKIARHVDPIEAASHAGDVAHLAAVAAAGGSDAAHAAAALGRITDVNAAPALHALAIDNQQPVLVRANAIRALASCADATQARSLVTLAVDTAQPLRIRQEAALALRTRGASDDVDALASALDRAAADPSPDAEQIRISLVQALRAIGSAPARAAIARHAARHLSVTEQAFVSAKT
jgi:HEAT repeat protein